MRCGRRCFPPLCQHSPREPDPDLGKEALSDLKFLKDRGIIVDSEGIVPPETPIVRLETKHGRLDATRLMDVVARGLAAEITRRKDRVKQARSYLKSIFDEVDRTRVPGQGPDPDAEDSEKSSAEGQADFDLGTVASDFGSSHSGGSHSADAGHD